ncbi:tRNA threonylcarbamoyladenosine biosynthesis protein TsaB [Roseivirga ehrenbergii]|uniref:tRNA threonylcarbamoyladenosine biosynthesis protein TsaB n=1 Tax=Roseivirga ehrenbergii (strain DSM 102268 / JCM 13514 / KCTC 12282 / NCIMB 14502 / KMM 6017) TaxID=279360 RepID=A0A150XSU5_ROSEK|nr:tRNA (adenosine(37)-N6)-threonylcarbamoyltransferase complex dimerization subunit type 1 TsaB [Roseivirga ehrenbergii]KYG81817.1 tRNA threonylcarbamoyladenosine biosynthesis protein TsaB [Roseivirga ehrenbergii]TCL01623.1 tRNA threonylcarbamoyladenosine biosynthesis protein TsaB [Roseivirga ehrenbergii]
MPKILSIETSTTVCSVALTTDGNTLASQKLFLEKSHSTLLTVVIEQIMKQVGMEMSELDAIAVSKGPGSYTGLRIGVSTAKGLCYALDKPLIAVNTLLAMANEVNRQNHSGALLCPMIDARRMEVYTALYDGELNELKKTSAKILEENSFYETLMHNQVLFFGNGAGKFKDLKTNVSNAIFIENITPSAWSVGLLANQAFLKGDFEDVAYFEPFYLKDFVATKPKRVL